MIDLDKPSHKRFAETFFSRVVRPQMTPGRKSLYLNMANDEELRGNYRAAEELRRFAVRARRD